MVFGDLMNSIDQFVGDEWVEALEEHKEWYKDPPNQNALRKINKELQDIQNRKVSLKDDYCRTKTRK